MSATATTIQTEFFGKTWIYRVGAFMCFLLSFICVVVALLFLFGISTPANNKPPADAAVVLSLIAVAVGLFGYFCRFNVLIRRKPLLRICNEGIEVNVIGRGSLDELPIPMWIKIVWLMLSMQGFKKQIGWVPWESFQGALVEGLRAMRTLTIHGTVAFPTFQGDQIEAKVTNRVKFCSSEFREPLETIALAIHEAFKHPASRRTLPSLHE
ncbi:MAG TPA: hypothetical protein EYG57_03135 [Planctomycetes bacterium]|nr:hypothetical protein [Planctomycetota bacterium]